MYGLIRLVFGCATLCCLILIIKKSKTMHKHKQYIFSVLIAVFLVTILSFIPFENLFVTFNSPETAFNFVNSEKVKLIIQGENSDFIIGEKDVANYTYLIVPKTNDGWKIDIGINTKKIARKICDRFIVYVYQYKNTNDYFVTILDTDGRNPQIVDSCDSKFFALESSKVSLGETFVIYCASVPKYSQEYWINVNGEKIVFSN